MTKLRINDSFIVNALRNCGYNNYSALEDIIDNSLEPDVNSTFVKVDFKTQGTGGNKTIESILVIDDGCGMETETLEEAMSLGSETGKDGLNNLGMYGAGMKTASFSLGQRLEVFTKTSSSDVNYAIITLEDAIITGGNISVNYATYGKETEEYNWFRTIVGNDHGTIVKISVLDGLKNKNFPIFRGTLKNKIGECFNKFSYAGVVKFYVCKDKVPYTDLMGESKNSELLKEGSFQYDGHEIRFKAWYVPSEGGVDDNNLSEEHTSLNDIDYIPRTKGNQGLYIYRQNRLVGKGITLGLWTRDWWSAGFRCEIFLDGTCDSLFGSTFTKMIGESTKSTMDQGLFDKLCNTIKPYMRECKKREMDKAKAAKENDLEAKRDKEEFYKRVTDKQNKNMMLKGNRKGLNQTRNEGKKEHQVRGKQQNPNPTRNRTNKWLDGFEERSLGNSAEMYGMEHSHGKIIIIINIDHPFYRHFYSKLDTELKFIMAQIISCDEIARQNVNYYGAEEIQRIVDNYTSFQSNEVRKSLTF